MPDPNRLPTMLIDQEKTDAHIDGVHLVLYYYGPAHTSGDLVVYLPDEKVVIAGDYLMQPTPRSLMVYRRSNTACGGNLKKNGSIAGWFKRGINNLAFLGRRYLCWRAW